MNSCICENSLFLWRFVSCYEIKKSFSDSLDYLDKPRSLKYHHMVCGNRISKIMQSSNIKMQNLRRTTNCKALQFRGHFILRFEFLIYFIRS